MLKFLIDEDMHRSLAEILRARGFETLDVRDCGLRGKDDMEIFEFAQKERAIILTGDLGFGNILEFPMGSHAGIMIAHFPNKMSTVRINEELDKVLDDLHENDINGNLIVIEPGKVRIRRK